MNEGLETVEKKWKQEVRSSRFMRRIFRSTSVSVSLSAGLSGDRRWPAVCLLFKSLVSLCPGES